MLNRFDFLFGTRQPPGAATPSSLRRIVIARQDTAFAMCATGDVWSVSFEAPAHGWIAVGFNATPNLVGTRFLIAANVDGRLSHAERLATPEGPVDIQQHAAASACSAITLCAGRRQRLGFSIPRRVSPPLPLDLVPGRPAFVMLAYSHHPDFAHHAAWRLHVPLDL